MLKRNVVPDILTDQTAAHDLELGYIPAGYSLSQADALRSKDPAGYQQVVLDSMEKHVQAMLALQKTEPLLLIMVIISEDK